MVRVFYCKYNKEFFIYLVVKINYYVFELGLVYYMVMMVCLVDSIGDIYLEFNKSLMFVGIMLYDLVKVIELLGFDNIEYIIWGNFIGYILFIDEELIKILVEFNIDDIKEEVIVLCYVILSYYG